jgi:hypothetical protein
MFRCCGAQSTLKLRENPNRRGFAGNRKNPADGFFMCLRMQNLVIRYIIASGLNGLGRTRCPGRLACGERTHARSF